MQELLKTIAESPHFNRFITSVILFAGVLVGMETYPEIIVKYGNLIHTTNAVILYIFIAEVLIKIGAEGKTPWNYFKDPWNIFDFSIVAVSVLPFGGASITVIRLLRLLRVMRLLKAIPKLQVLVGALLKSIPSMFYVSMLLLLLFYVYACAAYFLFGSNDPIHFSSLQLSMLTLFRVVTLEDWTDVMYIQMYGCAGYGYDGLEHLCRDSIARPVLGAAYFVSFVMLGTMIFLNLFIGIIMTSMDEAQKEAETQNAKDAPDFDEQTVTSDLGAIRAQLQAALVALEQAEARERARQSAPAE
jgi:voltage-gated sodium channel